MHDQAELEPHAVNRIEQGWTEQRSRKEECCEPGRPWPEAAAVPAINERHYRECDSHYKPKRPIRTGHDGFISRKIFVS